MSLPQCVQRLLIISRLPQIGQRGGLKSIAFSLTFCYTTDEFLFFAAYGVAAPARLFFSTGTICSCRAVAWYPCIMHIMTRIIAVGITEAAPVYTSLAFLCHIHRLFSNQKVMVSPSCFQSILMPFPARHPQRYILSLCVHPCNTAVGCGSVLLQTCRASLSSNTSGIIFSPSLY